MMVILYSRKFRKMYKRLHPNIRERFKERRNAFIDNSYDPVLENHPLHGEYAGCRSINVTGDYRAIYYHESADVVRFIAIGTHSELYE